MKRMARAGSALAAVVLGTALLAACNGDDTTKTVAKTPDAAKLDCTDPNITMGEWRKRCDTGQGGASSAAPKPATDGPAASPSGDRNDKAAKVGDTISLTGFEGVRLDATVVKLVDPATSDNQFSTPKPGSRFVAVQWRIANTGNVAVDGGPTSGSSLVDAEGQQFDPTYTTVTAGPDFPSGAKIPPGESRLGFVVYEVPTAATIVKIQYGANSGYAKQTGQWSTT